MKKKLSPILIILLLAGLLAAFTACRGEEDAPATPEATPAAEATPAPPAEDPAPPDDADNVVLRWMMGAGGFNPPDGQMVWDAVNEALQDYLPGISLDITVIPFGEYEERWMLEAAAGATWDIAWFGWMLNLQEQARMGALMPLNDLLDRYGQDLRSELAPFMFTNNTVGGNIYLIANNQLAVTPAAAFFFPSELLPYMDVPAFEAANNAWAASNYVYPIPAFMDVVEEFIQNVADADKLQMGISAGMFTGFIGGRNVWFDAPGGEYTNAVFTRAHDPTSRAYSILDIAEEQIAFYERISDWFDRGFIRFDGMTVENWDDGFYDWPDGTGYIFTVHNYNRFQEEVQSARREFDVTALSVLYPRAPTRTNPTATSQAIMSGASHPAEAMQFLNLLNSPRGANIYNMLVFGLEGVHWNFVDEALGMIELVDGAQDRYELPMWATGNTYNAFTTPGRYHGYNRYMTRVFNFAAMPMPLEGFVFDMSDLVAESIAWSTIMAEFDDLLRVGMSNNVRADIESRNSRLEAQGIRNFQTEMQRQIDEFMAGN
ncbi:MAG: ABC transporter substrate-binding protein [Defluviitaleaceae bacterium]|nr:ABC transporter substrate-binding protein [Defluviitaleaceae bacterium]